MQRQGRGAKVQPRRGERTRPPQCARTRSALTVRVPHRRDEAHLGRVVRKVVGELELRLEKAALPGARRGGGGARGGMLARGRAAARGPRQQQHKAAAARAREAASARPPPHIIVPGGPTSSTSQTKRLSSFGPTEMPSGGLFVISAAHEAERERVVRGAAARARARARTRALARKARARQETCTALTDELPPNQFGAVAARAARAT